jgi:hypothetical protein
METELEPVIRLLASNRWPWRLHATYNETVTRALDVYEKVNRDIPFNGVHWLFDHCETIDDRNIERIAKLGGGIAVQHRMAYQGEYFVARYGSQKAERTPPIRRMLEMGVPVGAGTDATRVASYNPWVSLAWLVTGRTLGGMQLYPASNQLDRETALRLWTESNAWFSTEVGKKARSKQDSWQILPFFPTTISRFPARRSRTLHRCSRSSAARPFMATATSKTWPRHCHPQCLTGHRCALSAAIRSVQVLTRLGSTPSRQPADAAPPAACMATLMHGD